MRSMRSLLVQFNVYRWAGKMLVDAARLRNQERVAERLADRSSIVSATGDFGARRSVIRNREEIRFANIPLCP